MMPRKTSPIRHPFTQHALQGEMTKIVRGDGAYLHAADGRRIIDAISSWWVVTHGHCHPHIVRAIQEQAGMLNQIIFAGYTHDPAEEVAAQLARTRTPWPRLCVLLRQRLSQRGSGFKNGTGLLAQHRQTANTHCRDATFLPRRHGWGDVGWRPRRVQCGVRAPAVRRYLNSVPRRETGSRRDALDALELHVETKRQPPLLWSL